MTGAGKSGAAPRKKPAAAPRPPQANKDLQQRTAELAVINSVLAGLAARKDMQGIYEMVGAKIQGIFDAQVVNLSTWDKQSDLVHYRYIIERGQRLYAEPKPADGIRKYILQTGNTVLINEDLARREEEMVGRNIGILVGEDIKSRLDVPMMIGQEVVGVISLQNIDREHAFSESDLSLLQTLAHSLGVALENARLFEETQRLLKETEQRAAELAVINSIQEGMAAELNFQGIVDLVGDKLREVFRTGDMSIRWWDESTQLMHDLYSYEHGVRLSLPPRTPHAPTLRLLRERSIDVVNTRAEQEAKGIHPQPGTDWAHSIVTVPILGSNRVLGVILLENHEREYAFGESEIRLLATIGASMGVALESARHFDETQRLLKETEQRAAELAVINSIQQGVAAELNFQAIVDLVGDKLREVLKSDDIGIRWFEYQEKLIHYLYEYEHGRRLTVPTGPPRSRSLGGSHLDAASRSSAPPRRKWPPSAPSPAPTSPSPMCRCPSSEATASSA